MEFCRGPNVYLREAKPSDLSAYVDALSDWASMPYSTERVQTYMRGLFTSYRYIHRPYTDTSSFRELLTICRVSDNEPIGLNQFTLHPGKNIEVMHIAIRPSYRQFGYRNEVTLMRDAIFFDELNINSYTTWIDSQYLSPRGYQTEIENRTSARNALTSRLYEATRADWLTWKETNSSSIPTYTYSGNNYIPPHLRT